MPEPLKNLYNEALINTLSEQLSIQCAEFDSAGFSGYIFDKEWQERELKARMGHIATALHLFIPHSYLEKLKILMAISSDFSGLEAMIFPDFVEKYGLDNYDDSIVALEHFTKNSSSEFAVRPFIIKYNHKMMAQMELWSESNNHHVRRLATEGCRSRLPWAMALPEFKKDPSAVMPILERLKEDESEYVRRSVANNLNDISKDNPALVINTASRWLGESKETDWLVKHGCRTLLKQGEPAIMALFGYENPEHINIKDFELPLETKMGDSIQFDFTLTSRQPLGKLRIEYAVNHLKKNNSHTRKIFKLSESENKSKTKQFSKSHSFKKISTRVYYAGTHGIAIIVNGHEIAYKEFQLES